MSTVNEGGVIRDMTPEELAEWEKAKASLEKSSANYNMAWSEFYSRSLKRVERDHLRRIETPTEPEYNADVADQISFMRALMYVRLGANLDDPERQATEDVLNGFVTAGVITEQRKSEILARQPGDPAADEAPT